MQPLFPHPAGWELLDGEDHRGRGAVAVNRLTPPIDTDLITESDAQIRLGRGWRLLLHYSYSTAHFFHTLVAKDGVDSGRASWLDRLDALDTRLDAIWTLNHAWLYPCQDVSCLAMAAISTSPVPRLPASKGSTPSKYDGAR